MTASGLFTGPTTGTVDVAVTLGSKPTADVIVPLHVSDPSVDSLSPASLTFTSDNWNVAQQVTVTGVATTGGGITVFSVNFGPATSADSIYDTMTRPVLHLVNRGH